MMINITREQAAILIDLLINAEIRASDAIANADAGSAELEHARAHAQALDALSARIAVAMHRTARR